MADTASSAFGFFGVWQGIYLAMHFGIDAEWNKVQDWPFWAWFEVESVMFPTVLSLAVALVFLAIAGIIALFVAD